MLPQALIAPLASLLSFSLAAQDSTIYQVEYICETKIRKGRSQDGLNTLYFSGNRSLYVHNDFPIESGWAGESGNENRRVLHYIFGDSEGLPVYMDHSTDTMTYKNEWGDPNVNFIFSKPIPGIDWTILCLEREIGGYTARLAVGEFGGRTYEVWFTEEIPVPFGPYKLNGLPGLILEAFSRDEMVIYRFKSFRELKDPVVQIIPPADGVEITMEEFRDIRIEMLYRVESRGDVTDNSPHPNYEIEKNKWTILRDYKMKRAEKRKQRR
ncbi:MAG: GLPGLI family protein [Saprospirales bacterium]|nr:MAG: GLPGLI family protein [Saprospirales bacterium]